METAAGRVTHRVCDNIGEERRFLIEAAENQLTDHEAEVEVERGESELVCHFALKCKTGTQTQIQRADISQRCNIYMQAN